MTKLSQAKQIMAKLFMAKINKTKLKQAKPIIAKLNRGLNISCKFLNFISQIYYKFYLASETFLFILLGINIMIINYIYISICNIYLNYIIYVKILM